MTAPVTPLATGAHGELERLVRGLETTDGLYRVKNYPGVTLDELRPGQRRCPPGLQAV